MMQMHQAKQGSVQVCKVHRECNARCKAMHRAVCKGSAMHSAKQCARGVQCTMQCAQGMQSDAKALCKAMHVRHARGVQCTMHSNAQCKTVHDAKQCTVQNNAWCSVHEECDAWCKHTVQGDAQRNVHECHAQCSAAHDAKCTGSAMHTVTPRSAQFNACCNT